MKVNMRKILSVLLVLCMVLSSVPFPTRAEEAGEATTTNGSYDASGNWVAGGTGSAAYDVDGTLVTLSKTATPVAGQENVFNITLRVETSTTTTTYINSGAVVLVIDVSGSMNYCADCGNEQGEEHDDECPKNEPYTDRWGRERNSDVENDDSRMLAAMGAAANFLRTYAGTDPNAARMLAIVSFQSSASIRMNWVNVAGGAGQNGYDTALNTIYSLGAGGGTNLDDGLYQARSLLNSSEVANITSKNVVALTDGAPTRSRSAGDGTRGSATINDHTAAQAANVRALATLYTVCFGVRNEETYSGGPTVGNFLSGSVATGGCAYNADNSSQLYGVFAAITESITSGLSGSGWTATDPMADMIAVSSAPGSFTGSGNGTYTWSLGDPVETIVDGNKTTYVYTITYQVTLDVQGQNFVEGQFFPTNERTYLNLGDGQTLEFPVPGVKGRLPRTDISVTKVWNDAENQDGIRSESVTVQLKNEDGVVIGGDVVLNADNGWSYTWDGETYNLIAKSKGVDHKYTVVEVDPPAGYTPSVTQNGFAFTVTNTHETAKQDITVTKKWDDANNQDGKRPGSITVNLLADGEVFATVELNADNGWSHTFRSLDVNKAGKAIVYTVEEVNVPDGYTASVDGMTITNSHETIKTEVSVQKIWDDADNQDGKRPGSVTVELYANGEPTGKTLELSEATGWSGKFENLEKYYNGGAEVTYTIVELNVHPEYKETYSEDGLTVTNTHVPETIVISGSKSWEDNNNQDGKRPSSITINLLADNVVVRTVTVSAENGWQWSFAGMPKYANGKLINYTIQEAAVEGYTPVYSGYNVTNVHTPETTLVEVVKIWNDAEDQDGKRPTEITVRLLANGTEVDSKVINSGSGWKARFENLPVYENGQKITYTITEDAVTYYETSIDGYTVTNTHVPETVEVSGKKTWNDNDDQDGKRPESITINLLADNEVIDSVTVTAEDGWEWSFTELPKYKAGKEISYSVTENAVENYSTVVDGYDVTNSYTPQQTSITVSKVWNDANNQDGIRPASVTVNLMADGKVVATQILNSGNEWKYTFTNLPVYRNGGVEIIYTVAEVSVPGYTTAITGDKVTGFTVTNSYTPKTVDISGTKTWDDNNNQDGARPESITINLLADNKIIDTAVVTAENGWKWSFVNLPEFRDGGVKIEYTISEDAVEGYVSTVDSYNVTNKHDPEKISLSVKKVWEDKNDQDGLRPDSIVVNLMNGETVVQTATLTAADGWSYTFEDLDKFAEGEEIQYSIEEIAVTGYNTVISGTTKEGSFTVTNSHTPETIVVSGSKTWNDAENQDDVRPESITIRLHADGKEIDSVTVSEAEGWSWSFENLPKYRDGGVEIVYTVTEDAVKEYTGYVNGFNVTNTHSPYETSVSVSKTWEDNDDQDGIRPEFITVILLANGKEVQTAVLNEGNSWSHTFTNLPVNEAGVEIVYTVDEQSVPGYEKVITGNPEKGFHITNSYTPETTSVSGTKTWADNNDQDGKRPDYIYITLLKDGLVYKSVKVTEADNWSWSFENLPKYRDGGKAIIYSIMETMDNEEGDYSISYNGYDVTNTHTPEKTSVSVTKAWADKDNQDGIRPNDVTVILLANGEKTDKTLVLSNGNNWTGSFTELDKYADGEEIKYTIEEMPVEGYEPVISGSHADGFQVTNVHVPETIAISGSKTWDDNDNQDGFRPESITIRLKANGKEVAVVTVTEAEQWAWTFENLPKFEAGEEIEYTITEDAVEDYSAEYDGFNVTNSHTPEQTSITVTKAWEDKNDQDGIRPDEITVILLANGEETGDKLVLDEECNWTGSFTELDKYAEGEEITYTVEEIEIEGYETTITGDAVEGFVVTNCHTPETISISGAKTWDDNNDQDGKRPEEITVNLMANGNVVDTLVVTEADGWAWTFENLPKYENHGEEITYAITETAVEGYTTTYDGYNITNSYTPAQTSVTVTKAWADSNNEDGLRPKKITITLYANGKLTDKTLVLTADDNWSGSFVGLPKYEAGEEIVYTIGEIAVDGYNTVIRGSMGAGFVVTNSHTVIPQTGDERTPVLWILLMLASAAAVGYVYVDTKKRRMNSK